MHARRRPVFSLCINKRVRPVWRRSNYADMTWYKSLYTAGRSAFENVIRIPDRIEMFEKKTKNATVLNFPDSNSASVQYCDETQNVLPEYARDNNDCWNFFLDAHFCVNKFKIVQ